MVVFDCEEVFCVKDILYDPDREDRDTPELPVQRKYGFVMCESMLALLAVQCPIRQL